MISLQTGFIFNNNYSQTIVSLLSINLCVSLSLNKYILNIRPCQIGILLSVNSSLTNLGTYSQKHTNRKRKHKHFTKISIKKHYHNMRQWSELLNEMTSSKTYGAI